MAVKTGKALEDALRQRAQRGGGVSDPANQEMYDKFRAEYTAEVNRKADNNIALAGNGNGTVSTFNQNLYDARMAANASAGSGSGASTGEVTTSVINPSAEASTPTSTSMINTMYDDRSASEMQALKKARETAQQGLNSIETGAKQTAQQNRGLADADTQKSAQRLREIMADRGLLSSGDNITANVGIQTAGQNALNQINQVEGNTLRDVSERRGIINNNASLDESALLKEINAARINSLIDEGRYQEARELQIAGLTGQLGGQRTLAGQGLDLQRQGQEWNQNYQTDRDKVTDNQWQESFGYQQARDQIADERYKAEFDRDNERYGLEYALNRQIQLGQLSVQQGQLALSKSNSAADNTRQDSNSSFNRLMEIWKGSGEAPSGIDGVTPGTSYGSGNGSTNQYESSVITGLTNFTGSEEARGWLMENAGEITKNLGADGYQKLLSSLPSFYNEGKDNSASIKAKATEAAMRDPMWPGTDDATKQALITDYMKYYQ